MADCVADIAVRVRPLSLDDSLARAAESVRSAPGGVAPVQEGASIVGVITAEALADWITGVGAEAAARGTVRRALQPAPAAVGEAASLPDALDRLRAAVSPALPVVDPVGRYLSMVSRGELLSASTGALRPPLTAQA